MSDLERKSLRPPDFEIRAKQFMHHVRGVQMKMSREHHYIELTVEDALATWSDRFSALAKVMEPDPQLKNEVNARSDELDQQTVDHSLVDVYAYSDLKSSLKIFAKEVNALAQKMRAQSTSELMGMLMTTDAPDEIEYVGDEIESMPTFHKTFKFQ